VPRYPTLFEINTRVWLDRLSRQAGRRMTLAELDDATLDTWVRRGFDWIWLLGVWQTGPKSRAVSRGNRAWRAEFESVLPDLREEDICGSCFAVATYTVDPVLGGDKALAAFRARLAARGLSLMLDFVPNHTGLDHPWVRTHPEYYVQGSEQDLAAAPQNYVRVETDRGERILAHGRDPNFPGWPDTLQLDYANPDLQAAQRIELLRIARRCDGVRCDMAMLAMPEVFGRTWGTMPEGRFWPETIAGVRRDHPRFTFLAEAYWDLEWELLQRGFDYCYDKRLYDRLGQVDAGAIRAHLRAGLEYQSRLARFLENHDEPRVAARFAWPRHQAAAMITYFAPGLRFFHQGQLAGAHRRVPVHLGRGPIEPRDDDTTEFYERLLTALRTANDSAWSLIEPREAWAGSPSWQNFVAYGWRTPEGQRYVAVVNYCDHQAQCHLRLPFADLGGERLRLVDVMGSEVYERDGSAMIDPGIYIDLAAWRYNLFSLQGL
jgi:hypothetical protein